jgi:hypothetical protein
MNDVLFDDKRKNLQDKNKRKHICSFHNLNTNQFREDIPLCVRVIYLILKFKIQTRTISDNDDNDNN